MSLPAAPADAAGEAVRRVLTRLQSYVESETPSRDADRCAALASRIGEALKDLGARVTLHDVPVGRHVVADFNDGGARDRILVMGHIDTVHPVGTLERQPFSITGGRITGPGCYDMKAGVALMIEAIAGLTQRGGLTNPITLLLTCDEEIGSQTSRSLIEEQAGRARLVLVPEPSLVDGGAKTMRKGVATHRITAHGRAAHAGIEPEAGVNAITELAQQVLSLSKLVNESAGTTVTASLITGGTATNVVPAAASATVDVRYATAQEGERVAAALAALRPIHPGASLTVEQTESRPPLERSSAVVELYQRARAIAAELDVKLSEGSTGGGSDGCLTAALGLPTLDGLGPRGGGAHSVDEHVLIDDLPFRLAFYTLLLQRL